jgi:plasmid maintenance system killer protein
VAAAAVTSTKRKRDISTQDFNRALATIPISSHQRAATIQPSATKKMKKTVAFIQSLPLNSISVNKNYRFVFYFKLSILTINYSFYSI